MTHAKKHKENTKLLANYVAFLDECTDYDQRLKLCTEIARLNTQNNAIDKMSFEQAKQDSYEYTIEVNAILPAKADKTLKND